jgi:hypothetical protein
MYENGITYDENTGEILSVDNLIGPGGMYAPLGIPAYNVLCQAHKHAANNVLACLLSHRHMGSNEVWPSLETIAKKTGHGKKTVIDAKETLVEYGFVKIKKRRKGNTWHNHYFIQDSCYHSEKLNEKARSFLTPIGSCLVCSKELRPGDFKNHNGKMAHWGCSGNIQKIRAKRLSPMGGKGANASQE